MLSACYRLCAAFFIVTLSVPVLAQEESIAVRDIKVGPLQLGMPLAEATRLLHGRGFTEVAPGDWQRQDSTDGSRHTRFRFDHVDAHLTAVQLRLVAPNNAPAMRDGYLRPAREDLGEPDEKRAGETIEDPRVVHIWRDGPGEDAAVLVVDMAKDAERHSLFMTLEYTEEPPSVRTIPVAEFPLLGMKLGMTQAELETAATGAGFQRQGRRYVRKTSDGNRHYVSWSLNPEGRAVAVSFNASYSGDAHADPAVGPVVKDIESKLGEDMSNAGMRNEISDHPKGPKLTVNLYGNDAVFQLAGDTDFEIPVIEPISQPEHDPEILAAAEAASERKEANPAASLWEIEVQGVHLGMPKAEAVAAAQAVGLEMGSETTFSKMEGDVAHILDVTYGDDDTVQQVMYRTRGMNLFDIQQEIASAIDTYGEPSFPVSDFGQSATVRYKEEREDGRTTFNIKLTPHEKTLVLKAPK